MIKQARTAAGRARRTASQGLVPAGIPGFDEITGGGLPRGRVTAILGGPGGGKTIFGMQFLTSGARDHGEPGIFVAFEESGSQVIANSRLFRWQLAELAGKNVELFDAQLAQSVVHSGDFDLLGLLAMIGERAKQMRAKRIVLDGIDVLLGTLGDPQLARREVFRLREWLLASGLSALITAKTNAEDGHLAADYDFLQFMADCVVSLRHRLVGGTATRTLRVEKLRGAAHSTNEFPFTITQDGIEVAVIAAPELSYRVSSERVSTGVDRLDTMLGGGYFRGSSVLITGAPGTAKTSLAAAFAAAAARRREPTLYVSFDEGADQIVRNVASIGIDLAPHIKRGVLTLHSLRARAGSPESHVARLRALITSMSATALVIDPISALVHPGGEAAAEQAAIQVLDLARIAGVTVLFTSLLGNMLPATEQSPIGISTIADTWMHLSYVSQAGERNRALTIIKSRGTGHSNQVRELLLSSSGIDLADVYAADGAVLMGTLRWQKENEERRSRAVSAREAAEREHRAQLALAETQGRLEALAGEVELRKADLELVQAARRRDTDRDSTESDELLRRRGADVRTGRPAKKRSKA